MSVAATVTKRTARTKTQSAFMLIVSYFLAILAGVIEVAMKLAYHVNPVAGYREAKQHREQIHTAFLIQDEELLKGTFAQEDRVMTVIMIAVLGIIGLFVIATVFVSMPDTGSDAADNSIDNFTTDVFGHFELFALVILIIIIALVVFYVRTMSD